MGRYFFEIAFDGTNYSGWQRQQSVTSVQQEIEDALAILLGHKVRIHGCGRTDAGVHASQYFFHLDILDFPVDLLSRLNSLLPADIAVISIFPSISTANAQRDAYCRTYEYRFSSSKQAFENDQITQLLFYPEIALIEQALKVIKGQHDFANFCKRPMALDHTVCEIYQTFINHDPIHSITTISISGNRFLHHMMRLLVGHLLKIGNRRLTIHEFESYLRLESTPAFFELAPANGLTLVEVLYY